MAKRAGVTTGMAIADARRRCLGIALVPQQPDLYCQFDQRPYTNSTFTRRPTIAAARCRLPSVMSFFGSSSRSTWVRLVFSSVAILLLGDVLLLHGLGELPRDDLLDRLRLRFLEDAFLLKEGIDARSHMRLAHRSNSF